MAGRLFAVVGPSGAGKDTLMAAAAQRLPSVKLARRVITRPSSAGGEDFQGVSEDIFLEMQNAGAFALHWRAHGLMYGVPATIEADLAGGHDVLFNGSRGILLQAVARYPALRVLHVTARPAILAERLQARGRESAADITARLKRASYSLPEGLDVVTIDNSGALEASVAALYDALQGARV